MKISEKYINEVQEKYNNKYLVSEFIKKDLALSYILCEIAKHIKENKTSPFNELIFKGGTFLAKSYLNYHRLSEDIDFTFRDSKIFKDKSKKGKQKMIRKFLKNELLPELKKICEKYNFIFDETEMDRFNEKIYCPIKNNEFLTRFNIYINKNEANPIKIEINFCDKLIDNPKNIKLRHLNAKSEHLIHPLKELSILSYSISDTLSEKLRAIITRKGGIHERDIFDLFLLHNLNHNCFDIEKETIKEKIRQGIGYIKNREQEIELILNLEKRFNELEKISEEEIKDMILKDYNSKEYLKFFRQLKEFLKSPEF